MLSVEELNLVLENLKRNNEITHMGDFSRVDIAFIAGLFLWYQKQIRNVSWNKLSIPFTFDTSQNLHFEYYFYFKQIELLYGIKWSDIYHFPLLSDNTLDNTPLVSTAFAPILFITKDTIIPFFFSKDLNENPEPPVEVIKIVELRNLYLDRFKRKKDNGSKIEKKYFVRKNSIISDLDNASSIEIFAFTILYEKIKPLRKIRSNIPQSSITYDQINHLWKFTQEYCKGLQELAKNIVEHSSDKVGVITIRIYDDLETSTEKGKLFETHVFDFGEKGIIPTLLSQTELKRDTDRVHERIYNSDLETLNGVYQLKDFIKPSAGVRLNQQIARSIAHYGLMKFYNLIENNNGSIVSSSISKEGKREEYKYPDKTILTSISYGSNYFFQLGFDPKAQEIKFKATSELVGSEESLKGLSELLQFNIINNENPTPIKSLSNKTIYHYHVSKFITNVSNRSDEEKLCNIFSSLNILSVKYVAINLDKVSLTASSLLRFLAHLSESYNQAFIVYNVSYDNYEDMRKDNEHLISTFHESTEHLPYWYDNKGILIFSKVKHKGNTFNFANMLYGQSNTDFQSINYIISNTFPNIQVQDNCTQLIEYSIPRCLRPLFYKSTLVPFDLLLCTEDDKTLFQTNLETLVSLELKTKYNYNNNLISSPKEYLESLNGYKISDTHFKIGAKLHSKDFFYAKRLFSNSYYTARIALHLALKIQQEIKKGGYDESISLTLAGYERYSELMLNLTQRFLREFGFNSVNRLVTIDEGGKLIHLPDNLVINDNVIVIVPIISTGSTAVKIMAYIMGIKPSVKFPFKPHNILWAYDNSEEFKNIRIFSENQEYMIRLKTHWYKPSDCPICYELDKSKPLFETDKSSLIPSLLFTTPTAKKNDGEISEEFNINMFKGSLRYKEVKKNNEHFLFSTETESFIVKNKNNITDWLNKVKINIKDSVQVSNKVVIISPCHESNAEFINLVNEKLFDTSATILHYQFNADYPENFKQLYESDLWNAKIFFVDDSVISGNTFFQIYNLINPLILQSGLTAAIFLYNKTTPEIHSRLSCILKNIYSFVNINLPLLPKIAGKDPLDNETERYKQISKMVIHDVLKEDFYNKAIDVAGSDEERKKLREKRDKQSKKRQENVLSGTMDYSNLQDISIIINKEELERKHKKDAQHLSMFNATHMTYEYFDEFSDTFDDLLEVCKQNTIEGKLAMMKVLSQFPFILYKDVREKVFEWHKEWLNQILQRSPIIANYNNLEEIKFLIRRSVFLGNYQIISKSFFDSIKSIFVIIKDYNNIQKVTTITKSKTQQLTFPSFDDNTDEQISVPLSQYDKENIDNFHIFLIKQYVELIQHNSWCANKLNESLRDESDYKTPQGKQFFRMLKIEVATVLNDLYSLIIEEHKEEWANLYKYDSTTQIKTDSINLDESIITNFLTAHSSSLLSKNKFEVSDKTLSIKQATGYKPQFIKYLWVKQFLETDSRNVVPKIKYSEKIDSIFSKLKALFIAKDIGAFFIVTDNQNKEYLLYDQNSSGVKQLNHLDDNEHKVIYDFLKGEPDGQNISYKTIIEFEDYQQLDIQHRRIWRDIYSLKETNSETVLDFLPDYKWLMLIRISDHENDYKTLGLIGFYSRFSCHDDWLAKQLLMLLREDIGSFIKRHHKNDEFVALSIAETVKRFAYLAGHGRQTMLRLANQTDSTKRGMYAPIVNAMHKLQYLFATITETPEREDELKKSFLVQDITGETIKQIQKIKVDIFATPIIENHVEILTTDIETISSDFSFQFNQNLLKFICFELIINAKKNRFHFLDPSKECQKNQFDIAFELTDDGKLQISFKGTGVEIPRNTIENINKRLPVKGGTDLEGLLFIHNIIQAINKDNYIEIEEGSPLLEKCSGCKELCKMRKNSITVTLNPMQE